MGSMGYDLDRGDFLPWDIRVPNLALLGVLTDRKDLIRTCFKRGTSAEKKKERVEGKGRWKKGAEKGAHMYRDVGGGVMSIC